MDCLFKLIKNFKILISFLTMTTDPEEQKKLKPLMLTSMFLQIPKISIKPTLDDIQGAFSQVDDKIYTTVHNQI